MIGSALTYAWHEIFNFKLILFSPFFLHVLCTPISFFILGFGLFAVYLFHLVILSLVIYTVAHTHTLTILCISISLSGTFTCILFLFPFLNQLTCSELPLIILSLISRETDDIDEDSAGDVDDDDDDDDVNDDGMNATLTTTFVRIMTYVAFLLPFETLLNVCCRNVNPYRITL